MIEKLRLKFISVSMLSVVLVLFIIISIINVLNYRNIIENADHLLEVLKTNNGAFPKEDMSPRPNDGTLLDMSPEVPFETRYFSVILNAGGDAATVDTGKIAAIDTDTAIVYAESLWSSPKQSGFISSYRYTKQDLGGKTRIIFVDCGRVLSTFHSFLLISILVSLLGILSVLILVVLLSNRMIKPVSESYDKQKRFITDAGHEIKTPLTIIDADTTILETEFGENEWLQDIQVQTQRLAGLTNDLIYLSRMEEENSHLQMMDFPFSDLISEMAQSFQTIARVQQKSFAVRIQPMLTYRGDEKAIRQLISILLDNALKYSGENGSISLTAEKKGKNIVVCVSNTADAVSKEHLEHLFDRFYRADQSRNSQTGGYGIGLSIAKAIVLAHRGKITASSRDEKSLQITIIL